MNRNNLRSLITQYYNGVIRPPTFCLNPATEHGELFEILETYSCYAIDGEYGAFVFRRGREARYLDPLEPQWTSYLPRLRK